MGLEELSVEIVKERYSNLSLKVNVDGSTEGRCLGFPSTVILQEFKIHLHKECLK